MRQQLTDALAFLDAHRSQDNRLEPPRGAYLEVELKSGAKADTLDSKTEKIRSSAARFVEGNDRIVAVYVPDEARGSLDRLLNDYLYGPLSKAGNPPNQLKIEAINAFRAAQLETLWTDDPQALPTRQADPIWWGVWCWNGDEKAIIEAASRLNLRVGSEDCWLMFPETVVIPVLADRSSIESMIFATGAIAELRRASDSPTFFVDDVRGEQTLWANDLAERIIWPSSDAPAVCLFDTGVNRAHSLIEPALGTLDMYAIRTDWGTNDHKGHGTSMAGLALHGDLTAPLADKSTPQLKHRLESVKILPPKGFDPNEPQTYGSITQAAIALPESVAPDRTRVFCMAITNRNVSGSKPSAWSAAIDQAAAGTMIGDEENAPKRLIIVSAGNIESEIEFAKIRGQDEFPVEDPAQAWNALSVGGYTDRIHVRESGYEGWAPFAPVGTVSPYSRTSMTWPHNAPFKPEIVMEAGNRGVNPAKSEVLSFSSLGLTSTGSDVAREPIVAFQATSAAAAQAARMAARIAADHPEFWPETIRGLMIHSAEWTPPMLAALSACSNKDAKCTMIRHFGYGVPDYERATASANHSLALFAQAEIQPFKLQGGRRFNECHYFDLPIPRDMLEKLENTEVQLKITLSYFIDPNPGMSANIDPQRYQSHGLRFDLRRKNETVNSFRKRVNVSEREDSEVIPAPISDDKRWMLGPKSISSGSASLRYLDWSGH